MLFGKCYFTILCGKKDGDWYIYPKLFNNAHKNVQKSYNIFKPCIQYVVSAGKILQNYLFPCTLWTA